MNSVSASLDAVQAAEVPAVPLVDPFGRAISYLRVSVTDRCDFRCVYCMAEDMTFLPKADVLSLEELDRLCSAFVARGVRKLRLTGGEPLVRRGIMSLVNSLSRHLATGALEELTVREFEEMLVQCVPYLGFPAVASATTVVLETLRELGLETQSKTSEERGLL